MISLQTEYMGMKIPSPLIAGGSGLTKNIDNIIKLEQFGAGAIILKSLFEEQILNDASQLSAGMYSTEAFEYVDFYKKGNSLDEYLSMVSDAKKAVKIPIIASINCVKHGEWSAFAKQIEEAGADGIELNIFFLPTDMAADSGMYEQQYLDIVASVKKHTKLPIAVKIGSHFTSMSAFIRKLSWSGISSIVLFNRFLPMDIDTDTMEVIPAHSFFSSPSEIYNSLRWIALLSGDTKLNCTLSSSTGIHSGDAAVKMLLAGAQTVQVCSALYKEGLQKMESIHKELSDWMTEHHHDKIEDFRGHLNRELLTDPTLYSRVQYMKQNSRIE
ncbi:MAG: dihydroorotate dehydrogenase-like protein [Bacteroidota bacterium]